MFKVQRAKFKGGIKKGAICAFFDGIWNFKEQSSKQKVQMRNQNRGIRPYFDCIWNFKEQSSKQKVQMRNQNRGIRPYFDYFSNVYHFMKHRRRRIKLCSLNFELCNLILSPKANQTLLFEL